MRLRWRARPAAAAAAALGPIAIPLALALGAGAAPLGAPVGVPACQATCAPSRIDPGAAEAGNGITLCDRRWPAAPFRSASGAGEPIRC